MNIGVKPDEQTKLYDEIGKLTGWEREQTNKEWIQSATTEQLAGFLALKFDLCGAGCSNCFLKDPCLTEAENGDYKTQEQVIAEWLMKPHDKDS